MKCPQCGSPDIRQVRHEEHDDSSGYHIQEYRWHCPYCGETSTIEEMEAANADER